MTPEQEIRLAALEVACDWAGDKALEGRGHPSPTAIMNVAHRFEQFITSGDRTPRCDEDSVTTTIECTAPDAVDVAALRERLATPLTEAARRGLL